MRVQFRALFSVVVLALLGAIAACGDDDAAVDGGATDGRVEVDAAMDARIADCQAQVEASGWRFCEQDPETCSFVFEDNTGCPAACAQLGLQCRQSYEDELGMCAYQSDQPALDCAETGHGSDYCVCEGVSTDAGVGEADAGADAPTFDAPAFDVGEGGAHEALLSELIGFGQGTTGGAGGPVVLVTTLADSGEGSLRAAASAPGSAWIRFTVSGTIALESNIDVSSDKTIDGRGADITITGGGLMIQNGAGNVILNNLRMRDSPNDLIRLYNGGSNVWVHHCDLSNGGDGAFDATEGVTNVTVSYTHIFDHDKAMLVGAGSDDGDGASMRWTGHHNWYEDCVQRLPFIRFGWAHSFNNLIEWRSGTAMSARLEGAQILVENNILAPQTNVGHKVITESAGRGAARFVGNLERPLDGDVIEFTEFMPDAVFNAEESYEYLAEPADDGLIDRLRANAGWQDVPWPG